MRPRPCLAGLLVLAFSACHTRYERPLKLLETTTLAGALPRVGLLSAGGEARPALLRSATFDVRLPSRALLTYGIAVAYAGTAEAPGFYELVVKAGTRVLDTRTLNPRAARGWRDVSLPLDDLPRTTTLAFELRLRDRDGRTLVQPPDLLLGVGEPTLHDLDLYGRSKGIVLISIDTLRRDHVGLYGYPRPTTPTLDALARTSIVAEDAVSVSSWTLPAHVSMLTSVEPGVHGGTHSGARFNGRVPTLATLLGQAGYATQAVTSHLYVSQAYGLDTGFQHLDFHQDRKAADTVARAEALIDRLGDRPFFLFLHFYDPHWHYAPPDYALRLFESSYSGPLTGLWQDFKTRDRTSLTPADLAHLLALYDGEIRYTDDNLGRLLAHLRERGLERNTAVLVTSDHGEEFLEHGSWEHQKTLYEEVVRVPLVLHAPGYAARREPASASLLDVAPTLLAWAGVATPPAMQGRSLLQALDERETYGESDHTLDRRPLLFLRAGARRWKAIFSLDPAGTRVLSEQWYDLATDPKEQANTPPRPTIADEIRARALRRWQTARRLGGPPTPATLSPAQIESLRALGYIQ